MAKVHPSNVDKKTKDGEIAVSLCNYTDVYYNDFIVTSREFMKATATQEQIEKFSLLENDVLITKDSEDPHDIAVAAIVRERLSNVVCGYHLALIRPQRGTHGGFLKRFFDSTYANSAFATTCNGLTRYGLGTYAINNVLLPCPPAEEQRIIASFLDHETAKIDSLIAKQERLIELLKEKRQAVISHAVTKGLNSDVPMKDSGVEWLGEVPEHWGLSQLKFLCRSTGGGTPSKDNEDYWNGDIPWVSPKDMKVDYLDTAQDKITPKAVLESSAKITRRWSCTCRGARHDSPSLHSQSRLHEYR